MRPAAQRVQRVAQRPAVLCACARAPHSLPTVRVRSRVGVRVRVRLRLRVS